MTRRERQGTLVVLAVIALLLIATMAVRSCRGNEVVDAQAVQVHEFESDVDSSGVSIEKNVARAREKKAKPPTAPRKKKNGNRPSSPSSRPRPLDPVPQF